MMMTMMMMMTIKKMDDKIKSIITTVLFLMMPTIVFSGIVKGRITEQGTGEPLTGATIATHDGQGISADIDGNYSLTLKNGTYTLTVRLIGYKPIVKEDVKVKRDELVLDFVLEPDNAILGEVTVAGTARHNTEAATTRQQQEAHVTMTGVSEQHIRRTQDKDAGEVIRRIPGVSIIDEKFVMVRGLSQRYNNVWLNGAAVPSSEADQRAFSFDIIPSSQLDNMMVVKSSAPEYPADFSGGFILVNTKDVPSENKTEVSLGTSWNESSHFRTFLSAKENTWQTRSLSPIGDISASASTAQRWRTDRGQTWALVASANFTQQYRTLRDMQNNLFGAYDVTHDRSNYLRRMTDQQYNLNRRLGALLNLACLSASGRNRYELKQILNHLGKDRYTDRDGYDAQSDHVRQAEYYRQRRLTYNVQLDGKHTPSDADKLDWSLGYAYANRHLPNRRRYSMMEEEVPPAPDQREERFVIDNLNDFNRETSRLGEHILSAAANWRHSFAFDTFTPSLFAGAYAEHRRRVYETRQWTLQYEGGQLPQSLDGWDAANHLPIILTMDEGSIGISQHELIDWSNNYSARSTQGSGYVSAKLPIRRFDVCGGVRFEHLRTELISNTRRQEPSPLSTFYDYNDLFASLNLAYHLTNKHQLRWAYGRTTNRPEFRELSSSVYYDFDLASNVQGNHNLKSAYIDNIDLGWEWYPHAGEVVSLSLFYKHFRNPIEWTYTVAGGTDLVYSYLNAEGADNYGIELDIRKQLDFLHLPQFSISLNASWIKSKVWPPSDSPEGESGKFAPRPMQGQSPYLVNVGLFYNSDQGYASRTSAEFRTSQWQKGWTASLLYNVIGKRLIGVGRSVGTGATEVRVPDSYEMPRHQLDLNVGKEMGSFALRFSIRDILAQKAQFKQFEKTPHGEVEQITRSYRPGRTIQLSVGYKF